MTKLIREWENNMLRYRSFFTEDTTDVATMKNEIQQLTTQLDGFNKELRSTQTPELRKDLQQKIYYIQHQIYDLQDQLDNSEGNGLNEAFFKKDPRLAVRDVAEKLRAMGTRIKFKTYNKLKNYLTLSTPKGEAHVFVEPEGFFISPSFFPPEGRMVYTIDDLVKALS